MKNKKLSKCYGYGYKFLFPKTCERQAYTYLSSGGGGGGGGGEVGVWGGG